VFVVLSFHDGGLSRLVSPHKKGRKSGVARALESNFFTSVAFMEVPIRACSTKRHQVFRECDKCRLKTSKYYGKTLGEMRLRAFSEVKRIGHRKSFLAGKKVNAVEEQGSQSLRRRT
jgi:hypothetical protein